MQAKLGKHQKKCQELADEWVVADREAKAASGHLAKVPDDLDDLDNLSTRFKLPAVDAAGLAPERAQQLQATEAAFEAAFKSMQEQLQEVGKLRKQWVQVAQEGNAPAPMHEDPRAEQEDAAKRRRGPGGAPLAGEAASADQQARAVATPIGEGDHCKDSEASPSRESAAADKANMDKAVGEAVAKAKADALRRSEEKVQAGAASCS